jgi:hypothetical protein
MPILDRLVGTIGKNKADGVDDGTRTHDNRNHNPSRIPTVALCFTYPFHSRFGEYFTEFAPSNPHWSVPWCQIFSSDTGVDGETMASKRLPQRANDRGRDARYRAPPAQNRTCPIRAFGSHLG